MPYSLKCMEYAVIKKCFFFLYEIPLYAIFGHLKQYLSCCFVDALIYKIKTRVKVQISFIIAKAKPMDIES